VSGSTLALRLADDVAAAASGDRGAFRRLVDATRTTVASVAVAILRDPELAQDVAQEVYLAAWRELPKLREPTSFLPWIRQVTRNRARMALRGRRRRQKRVEPTDPDLLLSAAADPAPDAMERLLDQERREAVAAAVDALPEGSREVVLLYYREGESVRQVADLLELSETAVKQRLHRARATLREQMVEHVRESAPGAAFTAGVMGALTLAAPGTAAAATLGAGKAGSSATAAGAGLLGLPAAALGGAAAGLSGGAMGIAFSARRLLRRARDAEERRGIWLFAAMNLAFTVVFVAVVLLWPRPVPATLGFLGMFAGFLWSHRVFLVRVTARRKAAERQEDPEGFARRERRERRAAAVGWAVGLVLGGGALLAAFLL
jgi:RNA polymerase sigma factor (sigma-70 family)